MQAQLVPQLKRALNCKFWEILLNECLESGEGSGEKTADGVDRDQSFGDETGFMWYFLQFKVSSIQLKCCSVRSIAKDHSFIIFQLSDKNINTHLNALAHIKSMISWFDRTARKAKISAIPDDLKGCLIVSCNLQQV